MRNPRLALPSLVALTLAVLPILAAAEAPSSMSDTEIQAMLDLGCRRGHPLEHRAGGRRLRNDADAFGPLWLSEPGESRARGVVLPAPIRVYLMGRKRPCGAVDLETARDVAGAEVWVAVWRFEDPPGSAGRRHTTSDQEVLYPLELRHRGGGEWSRPLWTRDRDRRLSAWYWRDWDEGDSLVTAFESLDPGGAIWVDYRLEHRGRSSEPPTEILSLAYPEDYWDLAWQRSFERSAASRTEMSTWHDAPSARKESSFMIDLLTHRRILETGIPARATVVQMSPLPGARPAQRDRPEKVATDRAGVRPQ